MEAPIERGGHFAAIAIAVFGCIACASTSLPAENASNREGVAEARATRESAPPTYNAEGVVERQSDHGSASRAQTSNGEGVVERRSDRGSASRAQTSNEDIAKELPVGAVFRDLVAFVRAPKRQATTPPACMLTRVHDRWRYAGPSEPVIQPVPEPSDAVFEQIHQARGTVRVLSRRGMIGESPLWVAAINPLHIDEGETVHVVVVTHAGIFVRRTSQPLDDSPWTPETIYEAFTGIGDNEPALVTASASIRVSEIAEVLQKLQERTRNVSLGVTLPPGTTSSKESAARASASSSPYPCSAPVSANRGDLPIAAIRESLRPVQAAASQCYESLPAHAQLTWRMALRITVDPEGRVQEACTDDETIPPALTRCVVSAAQTARFPKPIPQGQVTMQLPLRFVPQMHSASGTKPVCM